MSPSVSSLRENHLCVCVCVDWQWLRCTFQKFSGFIAIVLLQYIWRWPQTDVIFSAFAMNVLDASFTITLFHCLHIWKAQDVSYLCIARTLKSLRAIQRCKHVLAGGGGRGRSEAAVYTIIITPERLPPCMYHFQWHIFLGRKRSQFVQRTIFSPDQTQPP